VEGMLWKTRSQGLPHFRFTGRSQVKHARGGRKVRNGLQIPRQYCLFGIGAP
jgi:hypothetical protein